MESIENKEIDDTGTEQNVFFIRGYIRSGTNWVNNILNLHPDIYADGEFHFIPITRGLNFVSKREWGLLSKSDDKKYNEVLIKNFETMVRKTIIQVINDKTGKKYKWCGDRSPNPLFPPPIRDSHYFWIVRNVRDIIISVTFHELAIDFEESLFADFPKMKEKAKLFKKDENYFTNHPEELLDDTDWVRYIATNWDEQTRVNKKFIEDIKNTGSNTKLMMIRYEDLHKNIDSLRKEMYEFLDLDPSKANPISELVRPGFKEEKPGDHYRNGKVGSWRKYIDEENHRLIESITKESMEDLGYSPHD